MRLAMAAALLALATLPAVAGAADAPGRTPLRVAVSEVPPFAIREADGTWSGLSVDLWQSIANARQFPFELVPMDFQDVLPSLEAGKVDVAIGALTMTADREQVLDFTHPYYQAGLAIAVPRASGRTGWAAVQLLVSWRFAAVVAGFAVLLLVVGGAMWLLERRSNDPQFGGSRAQGLGNGFWWAAVTMTTVGYGDKAPVTTGGRVVAVIWMFAALVIVSIFTATVTSALTVGTLQGVISGPNDLRRARVATVSDTSAARYLDTRRIRSSGFPDLRGAIEAVEDGRADAVVYDEPILRYRNAEMPDGGLRLLPGIFENRAYAFAVATASALREPIDEEILRITGDDEWARIKSRYVGADPD